MHWIARVGVKASEKRWARAAIIGFLSSAAVGVSATAHDFIVVKTSEPTVKLGEQLDAGARIPLHSGQSVKVMRSTGEVLALKGAPDGVVLPAATTASSDTGRFATLMAILAPPAESHSFGSTRGHLCLPADALLTLDVILKAQTAGCARQAHAALDAYVETRTPD